MKQAIGKVCNLRKREAEGVLEVNPSSFLWIYFLLGLVFNLEDGGDMFLRNIV
jgi:hypothetical protein